MRCAYHNYNQGCWNCSNYGCNCDMVSEDTILSAEECGKWFPTFPHQFPPCDDMEWFYGLIPWECKECPHRTIREGEEFAPKKERKFSDSPFPIEEVPF